jgi:sulfite exporter TauE/SafE
MTPWLIPVFAASLAGSLHCAAMCGPFMGAVVSLGSERRPAALGQAGYHAGRLITYLVLGAASGFLGSALDSGATYAGLGRISAIVAGAVLVLSGASALFASRGVVQLRRRAPRRFGSWLGAVLARTRSSRPLPRALVLGLSTTLVPCGWLYAFVATAAGTGRVLPAMSVMFAFWLGTIPALMVAGVGMRSLSARLGARARVLSGCLVVASGVSLLALRAGAVPGPRIEAANAQAPCPLHRH